MIRAFVMATSVPNSHEAALEKIATFHPDPVKNVWTTTGRHNLLLDVETEDVEAMYAFVFDQLHEMRDILETRVSFPVDHLYDEIPNLDADEVHA